MSKEWEATSKLSSIRDPYLKTDSLLGLPFVVSARKLLVNAALAASYSLAARGVLLSSIASLARRSRVRTIPVRRKMIVSSGLKNFTQREE